MSLATLDKQMHKLFVHLPTEWTDMVKKSGDHVYFTCIYYPLLLTEYWSMYLGFCRRLKNRERERKEKRNTDNILAC